MAKIFEGEINLCRIANPLSPEQKTHAIEELINNINTNKSQRELFALRNPNLRELKILNSIIRQICDNLLMGNNLAAITLTNMLFEATIKFALIYLTTNGRTMNDVKRFDDIHRAEVEQFDDNDLIPNINLCKRNGYITKEECKKLKTLAETFRNPLSHASFAKLAKDVKGQIFIGNLSEPGKIEEQTMDVDKVSIFYMQFLESMVNHDAFSYFAEIMGYVDKFDLMITNSFHKDNEQ